MTTMPIDDAMALQLAATERLERARTEQRIAALRLSTLVLEAQLRVKVEAVERARRADAGWPPPRLPTRWPRTSPARRPER